MKRWMGYAVTKILSGRRRRRRRRRRRQKVTALAYASEDAKLKMKSWSCFFLTNLWEWDDKFHAGSWLCKHFLELHGIFFLPHIFKIKKNIFPCKIVKSNQDRIPTSQHQMLANIETNNRSTAKLILFGCISPWKNRDFRFWPKQSILHQAAIS